MTYIDKIRGTIVEMHGSYNVDVPCKLHYDETKNNRLLGLTENGLNTGAVRKSFLVG